MVIVKEIPINLKSNRFVILIEELRTSITGSYMPCINFKINYEKKSATKINCREYEMLENDFTW